MQQKNRVQLTSTLGISVFNQNEVLLADGDSFIPGEILRVVLKAANGRHIFEANQPVFESCNFNMYLAICFSCPQAFNNQ
jgi:hypothetical protein